MTDSRCRTSAEGRLIDEGGAYSVRSRQVTVLENGAVQVMYQSFDEYLRDQELHRSDKDRLSELPTEILSRIIKDVISTGGRIAIGFDYFGTNETDIQRGSLNILRVSKFISVIALQVLYGYRRYEVAAETDRHHNTAKISGLSRTVVRPKKPLLPRALDSRYRRLREATNKTHPIITPTDCLDLLFHYTPAQLYMNRLKIKINERMAADLGSGELVRALKHAKGLLVLELELQADVPGIMGFVYQLGHIRTIKLLSWFGQTEVFKKEMAFRNKNWDQPCQRASNTRGMTPEPGWVVLKVICH